MANSVTARFNDDCKVHVAMSDDTTVTKAVIIDADGNETDIGGGGGSSDFSTAKLTLSGAPINPIYVPIAVEMPGEEPLYTTYPQLIGEEGVFDVVLYKGKAVMYTTTSITTTGNIESLASNYYLISGDCTVTVTHI